MSSTTALTDIMIKAPAIVEQHIPDGLKSIVRTIATTTLLVVGVHLNASSNNTSWFPPN